MKSLYKNESSEQVMLAHSELDELWNVVKGAWLNLARRRKQLRAPDPFADEVIAWGMYTADRYAARMPREGHGRRRTRLLPEGIAWSTQRMYFKNVWDETPTSNRCAVSMQTFFARTAEGKHPGEKPPRRRDAEPRSPSFTRLLNYFWPLLERY